MKLPCCTALLCTVSCIPCLAADWHIETIAGTGAPENNGNAGPAHQVNIGEPFGVEIGPDGALYITEVRNHRVLRIDLAAHTVTTVAGCGRRGYAGDDGPALNAELNEPYEVRFDREGNMLFVEMQNHLVRRVEAKTGRISTIAGTGQPGDSGDGGPATSATLNHPHSIAIGGDSAIFIADIGNHRIRRIDPTTGRIESIAGAAERRLPRQGQVARGNPILGPRALAFHERTMWIALREGHSVWRLDPSDGTLHHAVGTGAAGYSGDDGPAKRAMLNGPKGIAIDAHGNIYLADTENNAIRRVDAATAAITTIAGSASASNGDRASDAQLADQMQLNRPHGICVGPDGAVYVGDTLNHVVRRIRSVQPAGKSE